IPSSGSRSRRGRRDPAHDLARARLARPARRRAAAARPGRGASGTAGAEAADGRSTGARSRLRHVRRAVARAQRRRRHADEVLLLGKLPARVRDEDCAMNECGLRDALVEVGRRLYARGYTASNDGNVSTRLDGGRLLMTPKNVCKGFMTADMMVVTDLDGRKIAGDRDPSSEMQMHLEVYRQRSDAQAVVHAHPPIATGFALAGHPPDRPGLPGVHTNPRRGPNPGHPPPQ